MPTLFAASLFSLLEGLFTAYSQAHGNAHLAIASEPRSLFPPTCCEVNLFADGYFGQFSFEQLLPKALSTITRAGMYTTVYFGTSGGCEDIGCGSTMHLACCMIQFFSWCGKMPVIFDDLESSCIENTSLLLLGFCTMRCAAL